MSFDPALATYFTEANELLDSMEDLLLHFEQEGGSKDDLNAIFRAAHTIKGSASLFALDAIVSFTHGVESLLDQLREDKISMTPELVALLLECHDHIGLLVKQAQTPDADAASPEQAAREADLNQRLKALGAGVKLASQSDPATPLAGSDLQRSPEHWHLSLRFGRNCLRNGMDPASFLHYLAKLGQILHLQTLVDSIPPLNELNPEDCHLGFEIAFSSSATKAQIEKVFEFVADESQIRILPPQSKISDFIELIHHLPEENMRLGEILVACGSVTQRELEKALSIQAQQIPPTKPLGNILVEDTNAATKSVVDSALAKQAQTQDNKSKEGNLIRVDADKLDKLINLIGELVIAGAGTALRAHTTGDTGLIESVSTLSDLVEEARDAALRLRMVQIGATFNRFNRVVRDMSKELGKEIDLVITGAETELDKTVVEKIADPLMHLVRNAMDHGIESAEKRLAQGKVAKGTIRLNAYHDSGSIVIEVGDDGAGLSQEKILAKAREKGLVPEGQALSESEIYNLVFAPGFSTAEAVTNLSGRGVGMDVVKRNITALRGTVELISNPGEGTTCSIRMPLTLAIIDGFQVGVGESCFVIPLDMVLECVELTASQQLQRDQHYLNLRGQVLPFIRLRDLFTMPGQPPRRENVVVVHFAGTKAGLVVDRLLGEFQTVIKPLGPIFSHIRGVGGSTILGNGEVALILDVPGLVQQASETKRNIAKAV